MLFKDFMYYKFTKLARFAIVFSVVLTLVALVFHVVNIGKIIESNKLIYAKIEEAQVARDTAIRYLQEEGRDLFVGNEFITISGAILCVLALFSLTRFAKDNGFFFAIASSFLCLITTLVSGLLLFFLLFTDRNEKESDKRERHYQNSWERYISEKSKELQEKN